MNPATVAIPLPCAVVQLRPCAPIAPSPRRAALLFRQSPQNIGGYCIQTHEADASVPRNRAMAGAALHSIPLAGYPAPLPPLSFEIVNLAHCGWLSLVGSSSRKTEPNRSGFAEWQKDLLAS
jgi:hypothetical protein